MKVKAIKKGYYGHRLRKAGDVFDMEDDAYQSDGKVCSWVEPADGSAPVSKAPSAAAQAVDDEDDDGEAI